MDNISELAEVRVGEPNHFETLEHGLIPRFSNGRVLGGPKASMTGERRSPTTVFGNLATALCDTAWLLERLYEYTRTGT